MVAFFAPQLWSFNKPELLNSQIFCISLYDFSVKNDCFSPVSFFSSYLSEPCYKHLPSTLCLLKLWLGSTLLVSVGSHGKSKIHFAFFFMSITVSRFLSVFFSGNWLCVYKENCYSIQTHTHECSGTVFQCNEQRTVWTQALVSVLEIYRNVSLNQHFLMQVQSDSWRGRKLG